MLSKPPQSISAPSRNKEEEEEVDDDIPPPPPPPRHRRCIPSHVLALVFPFLELHELRYGPMRTCALWRQYAQLASTQLQQRQRRQPPKGRALPVGSGGSKDEGIQNRSLLSSQTQPRQMTHRDEKDVPTGERQGSRFSDALLLHHVSPPVANVGDASESAVGSSSSSSSVTVSRGSYFPQPHLTQGPVEQEMNAVTSALYVRLPEDQWHTGEARLQLLEAQRDVVVRRAARCNAQAATVVQNAEHSSHGWQLLQEEVSRQRQIIAQLESELDTLTARADASHQKFVAAHRAKVYSNSISSKLEKFEALVVRRLMDAFYMESSSNVVSSSDDDRKAKGVVGRGIPRLTSFSQLERLTLSKEFYGTSLQLHWSYVRRLIPLEDSYFDWYDAALDHKLTDDETEDGGRGNFVVAPRGLLQLVARVDEVFRSFARVDIEAFVKALGPRQISTVDAIAATLARASATLCV